MDTATVATKGEYQTFDIAANQEARETMQLLSYNLNIKKRYLIEAENAYHGNTSTRSSYQTESFTQSFRHLNSFTDNWLKMIVDAYVGRLIIQGFNVGTKTQNDLAWDIFTANKLDHFTQLAHREAMKFGEVYLMVDPTMTVEGKPRITVETPYQVIGWQDPNDRSQNVTAMKYWQAADGYVYANLFTTQHVLKFRSPQTYYRWSEAGLLEHIPIPQSVPWVQYDEFEHKLGVCPVFTIENQPTLTRGGVSDLEELIPLQKAINSLVKNMLLASEFSAFPQKYALNVMTDRNADGTPKLDQAMEAALSRFWAFPPPEKQGAPEVKVGAFEATQLANYQTGIEEMIHNMAMISSIPAYRLMGKLANMSASAILAAEAGFIDSCRVKMTDYSLGYENAIGLALKVAGQDDIAPSSIETIWKDPSAVSGPNLAASLVALEAIGVPKPKLFSMMGFAPKEVDKLVKESEEEAEKANAESELEDKAKKADVLENSLAQLTTSTAANSNSNPNESDESALASAGNSPSGGRPTEE